MFVVRNNLGFSDGLEPGLSVKLVIRICLNPEENLPLTAKRWAKSLNLTITHSEHN